MRKFGVLVLIFIACLIITGCGSKTKYTVTFDTDGGSLVNSIEVAKGDIVTKPSNPTKTGYTFEGWYLGEIKYDFSEKVTKNITLKAKWIEDTEKKSIYTVTFDSDGGSVVANQTVENGEKATEPVNPTKEGYTFKGWYLGETKYDFNTEVINNLKLVAKWDKNSTNNDTTTPTVTKYTVTFDSNGGSTIANKIVEKNKTVAKPADPTKTGYTFKGWYLGETKYDFNTKVTKNITLKAIWEKNAVISYEIEDINGSIINQARLFVIKDGIKIAGTVEVTSASGKTATIDVPIEGKIIQKDIYKEIKNAKEK